MGNRSKLFEVKGYLVAVLSFVFSTMFYYSYTGVGFQSFLAGLITAWLLWGSYLVIRMILLASRG